MDLIIILSRCFSGHSPVSAEGSQSSEPHALHRESKMSELPQNIKAGTLKPSQKREVT